MDEYLSEREQVDRIRQWWKENGAWIIIGLGGGLLAVAGWNVWQSHTLNRAEQAAAIYSVVAEAAMEDRADAIRSGIERLEASYARSPYLLHARMALAGTLVRAGELEAAAEPLRQALSQGRDPQLQLIVRLRLARVLLAAGDLSQALDVSRGGDPGVFAAPLREVEGDILAAQGDTAGARAAYQSALLAAAAHGGVVDADHLELKIQALGDAVAGSDAP